MIYNYIIFYFVTTKNYIINEKIFDFYTFYKNY